MNTPDTEWEEGLQDIMESYIMTAELGHLAKDELKHKEELRAYWKELNDFIATLLSSRDTYWKERVESEQRKYNELLLAVGNKYEGETRHQTALRYIQNAETSNDSVAKLSNNEEETI